MSTRLSRRVILTSGLAVAGTLAIPRIDPPDNTIRTRNPALGRPAARDPLYLAMLDTHAARLAPILGELELILDRRFEIDALSANDLYAAYTIDLLQQTGRYDVVSIVDEWMPFFGRRGYLTDVPDLTEDGADAYPPLVRDAAAGIDGTPFVVWPWTVDLTCLFWNADQVQINPGSWSDFFLSNPDQSGIPTQIPLNTPEAAAQCFRNVMLSFGKDLVDPTSHMPTMNSYEATRALETVKRLAARATPETALSVDEQTIFSSLQSGTTAVGTFLEASASWGLWPGANRRSALIPEGRPGTRISDASVWMLGVPAGAPNLDEARELVVAMTSAAVQSRLWPETGLIPAISEVLEREWATNAAALWVTVAQGLATGAVWPRMRSFRDVMTLAGEMVRSAVQGIGATETLLAAAQEAMLAEIKQENEILA